MSKATKILVTFLFLVTLTLAGVAIYVSNELNNRTNTDPTGSEASETTHGQGIEGCTINWDTKCLTVDSSRTIQNGTRYTCPGPFDLYGNGCQMDGQTISSPGTYCIDTQNQCKTQQIDITLVGGSGLCFISFGYSADDPVCTGAPPTGTTTQAPPTSQCGEVCEGDPGGQNATCSGGLSCAPDYHCTAGDDYKGQCNAPGGPCGPNNTGGTCYRVCWGNQCGGGNPPPPPTAPTTAIPTTVAPTTVIPTTQVPTLCSVDANYVCAAGGNQVTINWTVGQENFGIDRIVVRANREPYSDWVGPGDLWRQTGSVNDRTMTLNIEPNKTYGWSVALDDLISPNTYYERCRDEAGTFSCPGNAPVVCGNNECNSGELCDGTKDCTDPTNTLPVGKCRTIATGNACTFCGDERLQGDEQCDDGNSNNNDGCDNECRLVAGTVTLSPTVTTPPGCGDSSCTGSETCERGNQSYCNGSGIFTPGECRLDCSYCGDGILQIWNGETCDDGNTNDRDACDNFCRQPSIPNPICGDGVVQPGEECDTMLPGSCGPGATCSGCRCAGSLGGLCGSSCSTDAQCPSGNVCSSGRCILSQCEGRIYSPYSAAGISSSYVCTNNGCDLVQCGSNCAAGGICPAGLACNTSGICVVPYCLNNECTNQCRLSNTALVGESEDIIIFAFMLIIVGIIAHRMKLGYKLNYAFDAFGDTKVGNAIFTIVGINYIRTLYSSITRVIDKKQFEKKGRKKFERGFDADK